MTVFDELKARGLLAQLTDEEEIKELMLRDKKLEVSHLPWPEE